MPEDIFLSDQNSVSHRWAILEDNGLSAWLYLTEPDSEKPAADCWIYNRAPKPIPAEGYRSHSVAPADPSDYVGDSAVIIFPDASNFRLVWSQDGESVAFFDGDILMGFIVAGQKRGYSRNLKKSGAWGNILDEDLYESLFCQVL
jgi:hypothetical protein